MGSETRKRNATPIYVRVSAEEKAAMQATAESCAISIPQLMRQRALGYQVKGKVDQLAIRELCRLRGDLGRLGGLLKLWLSGEQGWTQAGVERREVRELLTAIGETQKQIDAKVEHL